MSKISQYLIELEQNGETWHEKHIKPYQNQKGETSPRPPEQSRVSPSKHRRDTEGDRA